MNARASLARTTALARHLERSHPKRLFDDPYASRFCEGLVSMERAAVAAIAVRTRWFDDRLMEEIARGVRTIVSVGAGFDTRSHRLPLPTDTRFLEIDDEALLTEKRGLLPRPKIRLFDVSDQGDGWAAVATHVERVAAYVVLMEGLFAYLDEASVDALLARATTLTRGACTLLFDVPNRVSVDPNGPMAAHVQRLAARGTPYRFGVDDPIALAAKHDLQASAVHVGHSSAHFDRLEGAPLDHVPAGAAATWLVRATRA